MTLLFVTGTGTGVGKTVVTAAIASLHRSVAVLKPAQTGVGPDDPGDVDVVTQLAGPDVTVRELARYPEPLAPATAARIAGTAPVGVDAVLEAVGTLQQTHELVLVEGAGGLLVRFDDRGTTLADLATSLGAPVLVVAAAELGTLNHTALTVEAVTRRGLECPGVVIGCWPDTPSLAARCNLDDLPAMTGVPLLGAIPEGAGRASSRRFRELAHATLAPQLGGRWQTARSAAAGEQARDAHVERSTT